MVQNYNVVGICLNIVGHHLRATFTEGLDDFGSLWACPTVHLAAEASAGPTTVAAHFPGCAISDENSGFVLCWGRVLFVLSNRSGGQEG